MAIITDLPIDVIIIILCNKSISFKDIISLALSCNKFYNLLTTNNELWQKKFYQRWPHLREEYDEQLCLENKGFLEQVKAGVKCKKELWHYLSVKSSRHDYYYDYYENWYYKNFEDYYYENYGDYDYVEFRYYCSPFDPDTGAYFMNYYFIVNELRSLLTDPLIESDFTQRYHARNLLSYLQYYRLKKKVHEFLNYPEKQQILEKAVFIVAQWYQLVYQRQNQKYMSYLYVSTSLHKITEQVLECLRNEYPAHPICSISEEQLSFWENNNIDDNHWNSIEGRQIIESLCKVLYDKLRFRGTESNILKYSCRLDYVFKHKIGTTVILATIYHSVARRLGIRCDIIFHKFKEEFFLCWRAKYHTTNLKEEECFDIEFMRNEQTVSTNDCPIINIAKYGIDEYTKKSPVEVMTYMNTNLYLEIGDVESATQMYGKLQNLINQYTCN
ncbi:F-box only protein 21-like isoform X2 [Linepithema humile]|uniref:F-box only protein 21-like isoform X2 n=1 Tax=Linepithema humile TaxID=83485 RepID=UPI00351DD153